MKVLIIPLTWCILATAQPVQQGESTAVFRSDVSNVKIDVQVTKDRDLVKDLTLKDFRLFDQDQPRELLYVDRGAEPLSLVLLLDVSGSMRKHIEAVAGVARDSLRFLNRSDAVAVMAFGKTAREHLDLTTDRQRIETEIRAAVNDEDVGTETAINDAISYAAAYLERRATPGRRAVLILTDNLGMNVRNPDEKVIERLLSANCVLNAIVIGDRFPPDPTKPRLTSKPDQTLPNVYFIAQETGGDAVRVEDASGAFPSMVERIRLRYSLHYKTPPGTTGSFRTIRVELTPQARTQYPDARLRYRRGYYLNH